MEKKEATRRFTIRLTPTERARLQALADKESACSVVPVTLNGIIRALIERGLENWDTSDSRGGSAP